VVQFAVYDLAAAARHPAVHVAGFDVVGEGLGGVVAGAAEVEQPLGEGFDQQALPDRVRCEFAASSAGMGP